jgi:HEPN domain-containing protein
MGRRYIEEARARMELVEIAVQRRLTSVVVREAQECVELFLKGALRLVGVEPARTHDPAEVLLREAARFPEWFRSQLEFLAPISTELAGDRGLAFYGDERQEIGPQDLFDEADAERAAENMKFVAAHCLRLLRESEARVEGDAASGREPTGSGGG